MIRMLVSMVVPVTGVTVRDCRIARALFDVVALGVASLLPSGAASRVLLLGVLANPVDALRTGVLLSVQGTAAFGSASLAFLRFTKGSVGAGLALGASVLLWIAVPMILAVARLRRADI